MDKKVDVYCITDNAITKVCAGRRLKYRNECIKTNRWKLVDLIWNAVTHYVSWY